MLIRSLTLIISIFYSFLIHAAPRPLDLEMGKATSNDIKRMYKIKDEYFFRDGISYQLNVSSLPNDKLEEVYIWCDSDDVIQYLMLILSRDEFDNMVSFLSGKYEFIDCTPTVDRSFETELIAKFRDGDFKIITFAPKSDHELVVQYYSPKFSNRNYKPK